MKIAKQLLDVFNDANMTIEPKFKKQLRAQITTGKAKKHWWMMPKLALVPLSMLLVLGFALFANTQNAAAPHQNPFQPKAVSAQELIQKSDEAHNDLKSYAFTATTVADIPGPRLSACGYNSMMSNDLYTVQQYTYTAPDKSIAAYYIHQHDDLGIDGYDAAKDHREMYYETPSRNDLPAGSGYGSTSLSSLLNSKLFAFDNRVFTDDNGQQLVSDIFTPVLIDGKTVYVINAKSSQADPASSCNDFLLHVIVDARTYQITEESGYVGSVNETNNIYKRNFTFDRSNISADEALQIMEKAGFDKSKAAKEYPKPQCIQYSTVPC